MATTVTASRRVNVLATGIIAGIIGGILLELFLWAGMHTSPPAHWQFIASTIMGPAASANLLWLGGGAHYVISIVWALVFVLLARAQPALWRNPWLWGFLYGIVVMTGMTVVLAIKHVMSGPPPPIFLLLSFIAHTCFFGIPVALYVSNAFKRA